MEFEAPDMSHPGGKSEAAEGRAIAQAYLAAIVESSNDAIISKTLDGVITSWNKGAEQIFGYSAEEILGKPITVLIPPEQQQEEVDILGKMRRGERIDHYETIRVKKDGSRIFVSLSASPIKDEHGNVIGVSKIARDISERHRYLEKLKEREEHFHTLADAAPVMVWVSGTDKLCTFFNENWLKFTGRTVEDELGNGWAEGVHRDDLERCIRTYSAAFDARQEFEMEYRLRRSDGEYRWILDRGIPLVATNGTFSGYIGSCVDITERKITEEALRVAEEHLRLVTDKMAAAVTRCSRELRYVWVSPVYANWLRRSPASIAGQKIVDVIGEDGLRTILPHIEKVLAGQTETYEELVDFHGVGARWIHAVYVPTKDASGVVDGWVAMVTDITESRHAEQQRQALLEREHQAREQAEETSRLKDDFLATISHELRTPLSVIVGWSSLLRQKMLPPAETEQALEIIARNAKTQASLIEDLLDVSRIVTGKLRLDVRPVMLASVVESAMASLRPAAEAKGVRVQQAIDPNAGPVAGDPGRLQQIVWNLLSNAIKFTPRGGRVQLCLQRINSQVEITVSDTGTGIARDFLPHVFDRFRQQETGTTKRHGGIGLGLAIVRHLVELHGGVVGADSDGEGYGATFTVRLPLMVVHDRQDTEERLHPAAITKVATVVEHEPKLVGIKVLIIDDEPDTRKLLRRVLERYGADVRDAGSAAGGLAEAKEWRPSIVVSDIGMPIHDGYEFIRTFREWEREVGTWTPAVALTAYARSEDRVRALSAGFQIHVPKPIDPIEFALVIAGQLGRSG